MVPPFIRSPLDFASTVQLGRTTESLELEFKREVKDWDMRQGMPNRDELRKKAQKEICRDIVQFANTVGGCLLIGISETFDAGPRLYKADSIVPLPDPGKLKEWIEQAITNYLVPSTFSRDIVILELPQGHILSLNIPASRHAVSLWDNAEHAIEYVRRTSHGKEWMNPDEAERHIMDGSRASKLALEAAMRATPKREVEIAGGLWMESLANIPPQRWNPQGLPTLSHLSEYWFEVHILNYGNLVRVIIPYGVIEEAWVGVSGAINLLLKVRIIVVGKTIVARLEP